jgi:hypothetical protein
VSVALVLITGLLIASLVKLMAVDRGFTTERTITATVVLPSESYHDDQHRAAFYKEVLERIGELPGVEHAGFTSVLPLTGDGWGDCHRRNCGNCRGVRISAYGEQSAFRSQPI